jgi:hypothetical protein
MEISFTVNSTEKIFTNWLEESAKRADFPRDGVAASGDRLLHLMSPSWGNPLIGIRSDRFVVSGSYMKVSPEGEMEYIEAISGRAFISFEFAKLSPDRLDVNLSYDDEEPLVVSYAISLLKTIVDKYPESMGRIIPFLTIHFQRVTDEANNKSMSKGKDASEQKQSNNKIPRLTSNFISDIALNTTGVVVDSEKYSSLSLEELEEKAARFDAMRNGVFEGTDGEVVIDQESTYQYEFYKKGNIWFITYEIENASLSDLKGLLQIQYLLRSPYKGISSLELNNIGAYTPGNNTSFEFDELSLAHDSYEPVSDKKTLKDVKNEIKELLEQRMEIVSMQGDTSDIDIKINQLEDYIKSSFGKFGEGRPFSGSEEKARTNVTKCIKRAITRIRESGMPKCADHLDNYIERGFSCSYLPQERINWRT